MLTDKERRTLQALAAADGASFTDLVRIAQLDPAKAFRGADLRDVDFGESDLSGYDFTEADLSGANLERAVTGGAIFTLCREEGTRWPLPPGKAKPPVRPINNQDHHDGQQSKIGEEPPASELTGMRRYAAERMFDDLMSKQRALVLMPTGTGREAVLEEVICQTVLKGRYPPTLLLVNTVVEREQFSHRLRQRLGPHAVVTACRIGELRMRDLEFPGLTICNATYHDLGKLDMHLFQHLFGGFELIFTTALEKVAQLKRVNPDFPGMTRLATVDSLPIALDRPDRRQFETRMHRLFGTPSFVCDVEQAVQYGLLEPVRILRMHQDWYGFQPRTRGGSGFDDRYYDLRPVAEGIVQLFVGSELPSLFVLAKDGSELTVLQNLLGDYKYLSPGMINRFNGRWEEGWQPHTIDQLPGIILAPVTQQSMEAARRHPHVAVAAPLSVARAQDLAYRPPSMAKSGRATLYDLAGVFTGFPNLEQL